MRGRHKDARPGAARRLDVKQVALRGQVFWGVFEDQSRQIGRLREDRRSALDRPHEDIQLVARNDRLAEARFINAHEKDDLAFDVEIFRIGRESGGRLRHRLDNEDARHDRLLWKVALEKLVAIAHAFDADRAFTSFDVDQLVDQQERVAMRQKLHDFVDVQRRFPGLDVMHSF